MRPSRKHPIDFRKDEVAHVMKCWRAGDSCSLIGVGSVGKSNLLQHLVEPDVQANYLDTDIAGQLKAIIIDPSMLGPLPDSGPNVNQVRCWAGYELMMHRLFMAFYPFDNLDADDARRFYEAYQALQDGTNPLYAYMGLRYFELGLEFFLRQGSQIVFMFDEFDEMARQLPVKFFQTLRGLRDANKSQLSYLTFTRTPLSALFTHIGVDPLDIEPFVELFNDHTWYVGPYSEADAQRMIESLGQRNQKNYHEQAIKFLLWATGRYAGLMRAGFYALESLSGVTDEQLIQQLIAKTSVYTECRTIWISLTSSEQYVLRGVATLSPYAKTSETDQAAASLVQKRLLRVDKDRQSLNIEPPIFRAFTATDPT
ncbi:MAG: hypothetical protein H7175_00240 [Burkholderiales bacterium]|nr:hypothetical protein [Anaerolineae bacterium]